MEQHKKGFAVWPAVLLALLAGALPPGTGTDAALQGPDQVSLFGLKEVSPGMVSAFWVTGILLAMAVLIRWLVIPRFKDSPGRFQLLLEELVELADGTARDGRPRRGGLPGAYLPAAGTYILAGALFRLLRLREATAGGTSVALPAPLSDLNAAVGIGTLTCLVLLAGAGAKSREKPDGRGLRPGSLRFDKNLGFKKRNDLMKQHKKGLVVWAAAVLALLAGALLAGSRPRIETVKETMRDAVLHDLNRISLFGLMEVNPGMISAFVVTGILLAAAVLIRVLVIPKFKDRPGRFQLVLEELVGLADGMAKANSPHLNGFLGAYLFAAGGYVFVGTLFELLGLQAVTSGGHAITLPAPLSDVNAAIGMGTLTYLVILSGGIAGAGVKGIGRTLKEFSLPISMSFRLFGALLSGLLVTELVYYYVNLSFILPVVVGVLFTLLHALVQCYVLTMLAALFYGEVAEPPHPKASK